MQFDLTQAILLATVGILAGFINATAGGGSLLTLPVYIFMGFPENVANATNRVAILFDTLSAMMGYRRKGFFDFIFSLPLALSAFFGALIGAYIAKDFKGEAFQDFLGIVMLAVSAIIIFNPFKKQVKEEQMPRWKVRLSYLIFFSIGIYGGLIQAATGYLMIAALQYFNRFSLVKTNSVKSFVAFTYTIAAILIFALEGLIDWKYGIIAAVGQAAGAWVGSHWAVNKGDLWIKRVMLIMMITMACKLLGVFELFHQLFTRLHF